MFTPLLVVMIAIGTTDLIFALDSIPAIFGLTKEPYLVFTANVFALMGLRQLYFLLGGLLDRLQYLSIGLRWCSASSASSWSSRRCTTTTCRSSTVASRLGWAPRDPDLAVAGGHHRHAGGDHGAEPDQARAATEATRVGQDAEDDRRQD